MRSYGGAVFLGHEPSQDAASLPGISLRANRKEEQHQVVPETRNLPRPIPFLVSLCMSALASSTLVPQGLIESSRWAAGEPRDKGVEEEPDVSWIRETHPLLQHREGG